MVVFRAGNPPGWLRRASQIGPHRAMELEPPSSRTWLAGRQRWPSARSRARNHPRCRRMRQGGKLGPRRTDVRGLGLIAPAFEGGLDVAGEDLRQEVVAIDSFSL